MQMFRAQDMQKQASTLQEAAMKEPVLITYHDRPRLVLMSMEEFERLRGRPGSVEPRIAPAPNQDARDFLIAYSRGEITRSAAMAGVGLDPSEVRAFATRMNVDGIPWPKADRARADKEAGELLEVLGDDR
jgi:hypothetical protein